MLIPARVKLFIYFSFTLFLAASFLAVFPKFISSPALAQSLSPDTIPASYDISPDSNNNTPNFYQYTLPDVNPDVPLNQHTLVQSIMIETLASISCFITGIDPLNPTRGCLDIDPRTHKLGYRAQPEGESRLGGLIGYLPGMFATVYVPPASSADHIRYLASNFGIVKPAIAQSANGFQQLEPIQALWVAMRNITYLIFVLVFIIIGLGIILRVKIDPRTVMTLQNQIPRIIICILLVTFSYAIVGLMIDLMWNVTHTGINILTNANPAITNAEGCDWKDEAGAVFNPTVKQRAEGNLLNTPLTFGDSVMQGYSESFWSKELICRGGIMSITVTMARTIQGLIEGLFKMVFYGDTDPVFECSWGTFFGNTVKTLNLINPIYWLARGTDYLIGASPDPQTLGKENPNTCIAYVLSSTFGYIIKSAALIIIACIVIWNLMRIWLQITRAYVMIILYAVSGPLWIIMGLLPGKPLGFEKWLRRIFANLIIFPATALLLTLAGILMNAFSNIQVDPSGPNMFVPPLLGNPNMQSFGYFVSFGILLVTPGLLDIIRTSVQAVGKQGQMGVASLSSTLAQGSAVPRGVGRGVGQRVFGYDSRTQHAGIGLQILGGRTVGGFRHKIVNWLANSQGNATLPKRKTT